MRWDWYDKGSIAGKKFWMILAKSSEHFELVRRGVIWTQCFHWPNLATCGKYPRACVMPERILVPRGRGPFGQHQESRPMERINFRSKRRKFVLYSQPIKLSDLTLNVHRVTKSPWIVDLFHLLQSKRKHKRKHIRKHKKKENLWSLCPRLWMCR